MVKAKAPGRSLCSNTASNTVAFWAAASSTVAKGEIASAVKGSADIAMDMIILRNCLATMLAAGHRVDFIDQRLSCQKVVKRRHAVVFAERHLAHLRAE